MLTFPVSISGAQERKSRRGRGQESEQERDRDKGSLFHMQVGTAASLPSLPGDCGQSWLDKPGVWKCFTTHRLQGGRSAHQALCKMPCGYWTLSFTEISSSCVILCGDTLSEI